MGRLCGANFHQGYDPVLRSAERFIHDFQDWKAIQGQDNLCFGWCGERQADASGRRHFELEGCHADSLSGCVADGFEGLRTKTPVYATIEPLVWWLMRYLRYSIIIKCKTWLASYWIVSAWEWKIAGFSAEVPIFSSSSHPSGSPPFHTLPSSPALVNPQNRNSAHFLFPLLLADYQISQHLAFRASTCFLLFLSLPCSY